MSEQIQSNQGEPKLELLPCPFCGGTVFFVAKGRSSMTRLVICQSCGANGPSRWNELIASILWNNRPSYKGKEE